MLPFPFIDGQQYATGLGSWDSTVVNNSEQVENLYKEAEIQWTEKKKKTVWKSRKKILYQGACRLTPVCLLLRNYMSAEDFRDSNCQSTRHSKQGSIWSTGKKTFPFHFQFLMLYQQSMLLEIIFEGIMYMGDNRRQSTDGCQQIANANYCRDYLHEPVFAA